MSSTPTSTAASARSARPWRPRDSATTCALQSEALCPALCPASVKCPAGVALRQMPAGAALRQVPSASSSAQRSVSSSPGAVPSALGLTRGAAQLPRHPGDRRRHGFFHGARRHHLRDGRGLRYARAPAPARQRQRRSRLAQVRGSFPASSTGFSNRSRAQGLVLGPAAHAAPPAALVHGPLLCAHPPLPIRRLSLAERLTRTSWLRSRKTRQRRWARPACCRAASTSPATTRGRCRARISSTIASRTAAWPPTSSRSAMNACAKRCTTWSRTACWRR